MEALRLAALWAHIFFGFLALMAGSVALGSVKGRRSHRHSGKVFYYSMLTVAATALALASTTQNWFLTSIALFAGYQTWTGHRSIVNKGLHPNTGDWIITVLALCTAIWMIVMRIPVLWVFGGILGVMAITDLLLFIRLQRGLTLNPTEWLTRHIGRMSGAYIATLTAFIVVNVREIQPGWLLWLMPTFVGVPLIVYWTRKVAKGARVVAASTLLVLATGAMQAQEIRDTFYTPEYLDRSTRFAWMTLGGDLHLLAGGHIELPMSGKTTFGPTLQPRLTFGGIHFWGHADFYVTFPLPAALDVSRSPFEELRFREGVETGARIYPFALKSGVLRPFVGISFKPLTYGHASPNVDYGHGYALTQRFVGPAQLGLTWARKKTLLTAVMHYNFSPDFDYAVSPIETARGVAHPMSLTLSVLRYMDMDRSARTEHAFRQQNIKRYLLEAHGKMSAFYWGLGPSAAIQMGRSAYMREEHPTISRRLTGGIMPDVTFGYYFAGADLNMGLSYRFLGDRISAWDSDVRLRRHSFMLESYKFLFNYLGFVPYAGVTLSLEDLQVRANGEVYAEQKPALGLIFGWDIRVTRTGTSLLRTNLRYIPGLDMDIEGKRMRFDHLEFNFIQYVRYIGRGRFYKRFR